MPIKRKEREMTDVYHCPYTTNDYTKYKDIQEPQYKEVKPFGHIQLKWINTEKISHDKRNPVYDFLPLDMVKTVLLESKIYSVNEINEEIKALSTLSGFKTKRKKNK